MARAKKALGASQEVELRLAKAMAHPVRVKILELLSHRPMAPVEVSNALDIPISNMSYHFRTLLELECIAEVESEPVRGSLKTTYRSTVNLWVSKACWGGMEGKAMREMQRRILELTAGRVTDAIEAQTFERREDIQLTIQTLEVTEEQFAEVSRMFDNITERLAEIKETNSPDESTVRFPATFSVMGYESPTLYEE